ncbi:hypothetical protein [Alteromonas facilis]|uniref:hypothetical protein n=1 Tax=Alteromonas facilis TaxID=2048004 RepID=UPI000C283298|nr:hypothetical protein [Alteromonas facilis]
MKGFKSVALTLGLLFIATYSYTLVTGHYGTIGSGVGVVIGVLIVVYAVAGKDLIDSLYMRLTGKRFNGHNNQ